MEIIFKGKNFSLTPGINDYVRKKIKTLEKFLENFNQETTKFEVEVDRINYRKRSGDIFRAEINLSLGGQLLRAESSQGDLFAAVDEVRDDLERQIKKFKTKKDTIFIRGARSIKKKIALSNLARFRKK